MKKMENHPVGRTKRAPSHFKKTSSKTALFLRIASALCATVCIISALGLAVIGYMVYAENQQLEQLAVLVGKVPSNAVDSPSSAVENSSGDTQNNTDSTSQYEVLRQRNADFWGWIQIDGTRINYPIMHSPDDPEKYLHANFDGGYSYSGLPFLDASCTEASDNLLIYGHNMLDGSMFTTLTKYKEKSFWESHPIIQLDTISGSYEYEIVYAFYDRVYSRHEDVFKFYQFVYAENEQDFLYNIANLEAKQLYDTGVDVSFGDQLLTLITCEYHTANGRFVVVARQK